MHYDWSQRAYLKIGMHAGKTPYKDEGRHWGDASIRKRIPMIVSSPPEAMAETWNGFFATPLRIINFADHLVSDW